jgi:uncharacterized damage-inducible protein DinB
MPSAAARSKPDDLGRTAARMFTANDRLNQIVIDALPPAIWNAQPPGKVRTIAAIFSHMHNIRTKWIRLTAPHIKVPPRLDKSRCTPDEARAALADSAAGCAQMLTEALAGSRRRIAAFRRDGWARPWPANAEMLCYMLVHEAHHRGQVCMLAHQLGFRLPNKVISDIWSWEKLRL